MKIFRWDVVAPKGRGHIATYTDKMQSDLLRTNEFEKITVIDIEYYHSLVNDLKSDDLFKKRIEKIEEQTALLKKASDEIRSVLAEVKRVTYDI